MFQLPYAAATNWSEPYSARLLGSEMAVGVSITAAKARG